MKQEKNIPVLKLLLKVLQGALVGLGAVLPGISGGVLCVVFGIYKTIMEFLADPIRKFKTHIPKLFPYGVGVILGFMGIAKLLAFLLDILWKIFLFRGILLFYNLLQSFQLFHLLGPFCVYLFLLYINIIKFNIKIH